jgi:predicted peptidase
MSEARLLKIPYASPATGAERDFLLYLPTGHSGSPSKLWPVLLFLHGNGERGDAKSELDFLLKNGPLYEAWIQKRDLPFIIAAPQLPMFGQDANAEYLRKRSRAEIPERLAAGVPAPPPPHPTEGPMLGAVPDAALPHGGEGPPKGWPELEADLVRILDHVLGNYRADPARQYLSGVSYGGFGTWYLASKYPKRFAALVPVVGYPHPDHVPAIAAARTPIWCFAGGRDRSVEVKYFYPALNLLEELGHRGFRFTIEADMGHDVWARVYGGRDVYDWMLGHSNPHAAPDRQRAGRK